MKVLPRTRFGNPILRARSRTVPASFLRTQEFQRLIREMFYTMRQVHGVGLAAPQVGLPLRLAVIRIQPERSPSGKTHAPLRRILVNPKIIWRSTQTSLDWEGCLSFPAARGLAKRSTAVRVSYMNEKGERVTEEHRGFAARVFQHEIDHLNGILYVDRMPNMRSLMAYEEFLGRVVK